MVLLLDRTAMSEIESFKNPVLDMFDAPQFDDSLAYDEEFELLADSGSTIAPATKNITFQITDKNAFYDLASSHVQVRFKIVKLDETNFDDGELITLASSGSALFRGAKLTIDGADVEAGTDAHIRGLLLDLLEHRASDAATAAQQWFYPEPAASAGKVAAGTVVEATNPSAIARFNRHKNNAGIVNVSTNEVELWIPLAKFFGFVRDNRAAIIAQAMRIDLDVANDGMGITKQGTLTYLSRLADGTARITWCSLWLRKIVPTDKYKAEIISKLSSGSQYKKLWKQHDVHPLRPTVPDLAGPQRLSIAHKFARLGRIYIVAMARGKTVGKGELDGYGAGADNTVARQAQYYNPGTFDLINYKNASVQVNGTSFPAKPYIMDFSKGQYQRAYEAWLEAVRSHNGDTDVDTIDYATFKKCYPILTFDINSPGQALYDQTSQSEILLSFEMDNSPVMTPYSTATAETQPTVRDKEYTLYAIVESYRGGDLSAVDGFMKFTSISAM